MSKHFILECLKTSEKDRIAWDNIYRHPLLGGCFKDHQK